MWTICFCQVFARSEPAARAPFSPWRLLVRKRLVDEDDVIPDLLDALPWDIVFLAASEKAEKAKRPGHDQRAQLSLRQAALHIADIAEPAAVVNIDDLLAAEVGKAAVHRISLPFRVFYSADGTSYPSCPPSAFPGGKQIST